MNDGTICPQCRGPIRIPQLRGQVQLGGQVAQQKKTLEEGSTGVAAKEGDTYRTYTRPALESHKAQDQTDAPPVHLTITRF